MGWSAVMSWLSLYGSVVYWIEGAPTEDNMTVCHYQEDSVTKPCELFRKVGCQNISYKPRSLEGPCELGKMKGQPHYYLTISKLWDREGFLGINGTDYCWKFKVGTMSDPENHITMDLDFFPETSLTNIQIYRDGERCNYLDHSNYSLRHIREKASLAFTLTPVPGVREVKLVLFSGDCEIDCSRNENDCSPLQEKYTMKDFLKPRLLPVPMHRYHCIRVDHGECRFSTVTVKKEDPPPPPTPRPNDESFRPVVIWSSVTIVGVILVVIFVKKMCSFGTFQRESSDTKDPDMPPQWQCIHQMWTSSPVDQKVLLLYSRDCPQFCAVVRALGQLLQTFGNFKVLDPMQQNEMERVSENISGWLTQHLQSPDVKLVIVVSEGAMVRQNALLTNQLVYNDEPHFLDPLFTLALQQMHERPQLGNDYRRIFPVRFEDFTPSEVSLSLIVPLKCYVLQRHLGKLIAQLRHCNSAPEVGYEDIRIICPQEVSQLESTIRNMKSYCADNPHYVKNSFSVVVR